MKVRIPQRAMVYITGTQAYQRPLDDDDKAAQLLFMQIDAVLPRGDGSRWVELNEDEKAILLDYATAWVEGARDNAGPEDMDALADLRSLQSLINHLTR